ncbi:MAG: hypothetical protein ACTSP5_00260 [Candidatus Heimdallarchaeota archaeon]
MTKAVEKVDLKIPNNRIEKVIFSFDIVNVILGLITVFTVMIFPFIYWGGQMGVVPTIIGFSIFGNSYDPQYIPAWFGIDIRILISLVSFCVVNAFFSIFQYVGKLSFLKSKLISSPLGVLFSCAIIILTVLLKNALVEYFTLLDPFQRIFLGGAYFIPLVYGCILIFTSITQFVLSFEKKFSIA